jgi:hypothetical protein
MLSAKIIEAALSKLSPRTGDVVVLTLSAACNVSSQEIADLRDAVHNIAGAGTLVLALPAGAQLTLLDESEMRAGGWINTSRLRPFLESLRQLVRRGTLSAELLAVIEGAKTTAPELVPVVSSNIKAIGYDAAKRSLLVQFTTGVYAYADVSPETYAAFMEAESKGKFFAAYIKKPYLCEKVG